ncbi:DUF3592 domain-containing protein [Streptomyces sp. NBC_00820]|uniref:DUF3592 domain-containing protein n=1 Tax=Streptomyces sp. NBC_00820 TaxID=2975842 RepID=UPI002ED2DB2E|nr:DUF3592 domain-containing protein [Streptomyces sp. NBC_00820]
MIGIRRGWDNVLLVRASERDAVRFRLRGRGAPWWITLGVTAFGLLFLTIGCALTWQSISFLTGADRARGTVVSVEWRTDHDSYSGSSRHRKRNSPMAYPVVEFTPANGPSRTFESSSGANPPSYDEGDDVEVLYRADAPGDARINSFGDLWLAPVIFGGFGLLATAIPMTIVVLRRRRRPRKSLLAA